MELTYLLARVIEEFYEFLEENKFKEYCGMLMTHIADIDAGYMYVLLAAVNRTMMESLGGWDRLKSGIARLLQINVNAKLERDTVEDIEIFLMFVVNYLNIHQYVP